MVNAGLFSSASPEWYTPNDLLHAIQHFMGTIDLDPASDPCYHVPATRHYTQAENGLLLPWTGRVFLNPPYGRQIGLWTAKALSEPLEEIIMLLPARTDTKWFQPLFDYPICFIAGRLKFISPGTPDLMPAGFPSALVYRGARSAGFRGYFSRWGKTTGANKPLYLHRTGREVTL